MFVCNKVDTSTGAQTFDARSSDEEETEKKVDKEKIVFSQLQQHGLIEESESYDSCSSFFGISAKKVREDRRKKALSRATELFSKFQEGMFGVLEETVKRQAKEVVDKLIIVQTNLVHAMGRKRQDLLHKFESPLEFDTAKSVGKSLYDSMTSTIGKKIGMVVNCNLLNLEEKFMRKAVHFPEQVPPMDELEARVNDLLLLKENSKYHPRLTWNKEDGPFILFLIILGGLVLDRTFNDLKRGFEFVVDETKEVVEVHSRNIINPRLRQVFGVAYGSGLPATECSPLPNKPSSVLAVRLKSEASKAFREVLIEIMIEGFLHAKEWKSLNAYDFNMTDTQSRRKILELIFSKVMISNQRITHAICVACESLLHDVHENLLKDVDGQTGLNDLVSNNWSQQLEEMAALYIPTVRHLAVEGFALQFLLNNGPLTLGPEMKSTKHGTIHGCTGWTGEVSAGEFVVKVIKEEKVEPDVWTQTAVDLIDSM